MQAFTTLSGPAAPLLLANVDTDVIIRIERLTGHPREQLGRFAFEALRYRPDGSDDPEFVLNQSAFRGAAILVAAGTSVAAARASTPCGRWSTWASAA